MATAGDIARAALAAVDSSANFVVAVQWTSERYAQLANRLRLRHLRRIGGLVIPAALTTGTVTAIPGSAILTGDATAQAAWSSALAGRWLRLRSTWYEITGVETTGGSTSLRLSLPYAEDAAAGVAYTAVQRYAQLAPRARYAGHFVATRLWARLEQRSLGELEILAPGRPYVGALAGGGYVADIAEQDGRRRVEIWPYATRDEPIAYVYYEKPAELEPETVMPEAIDPYLLKQGVLIDVYRHAAMVAGKDGKLDWATTLGNWEQRAEVRWANAMMEAVRADRGADDSTFLLAHRASFGGPRGIYSASDQGELMRGARL